MVRPEPNSWSNCRSTEIRVTARLAAGTEAISFRAAVRDTSTAIMSVPARTVAPRRRPEISPTSPKIDPCSIGTVIDGLSLSTSTSAFPCAMPNRQDDPGSAVQFEHDLARLVRSHFGIEHELAHLERRELVQNRHICAQHFEPFVDGTARLEARELGLEGLVRQAGFRVRLPLMNSTTSWPWFMQCLISG